MAKKQRFFLNKRNNAVFRWTQELEDSANENLLEISESYVEFKEGVGFLYTGGKNRTAKAQASLAARDDAPDYEEVEGQTSVTTEGGRPSLDDMKLKDLQDRARDVHGLDPGGYKKADLLSRLKLLEGEEE